jgi:uncharacterized RDD family membrane protein YckC
MDMGRASIRLIMTNRAKARQGGLDLPGWRVYTYRIMAPTLLPGFSHHQDPEELELRPAKIAERFIAYVLDAVPFAGGYLLSLIVMTLKLGIAPDTGSFLARLSLVWAGLYLVYQFIGNATGATVGKRLMGLWIVGKDGRPLGLMRSFLRAGGYALSTPLFNFGFLVAFFHPESRALHDLISGSLVIEARPRNRAESAVLFFGALGLLGSIFGGTLYLYKTNPTTSDLLALEKAREGLKVMAQIEERFRVTHGTYTDSLSEIAKASGDVERFRSAMLEIFEPNLFQIEAGRRAYRLSAVARDRRRTRVTLEGSPTP